MYSIEGAPPTVDAVDGFDVLMAETFTRQAGLPHNTSVNDLGTNSDTGHNLNYTYNSRTGQAEALAEQSGSGACRSCRMWLPRRHLVFRLLGAIDVWWSSAGASPPW